MQEADSPGPVGQGPGGEVSPARHSLHRVVPRLPRRRLKAARAEALEVALGGGGRDRALGLGARGSGLVAGGNPRGVGSRLRGAQAWDPPRADPLPVRSRPPRTRGGRIGATR